VEDVTLLFTDGINLRFHQSLAEAPEKHQLLLEFTDGTALSASVAMYGGLWCFPGRENQNPYYLAARDKPSPLTDAFNGAYFDRLFQADCEKLSMKAFLATQQRVPGLGNGVLQDILYHARLHPKTKAAALDAAGREALFQSVKTVLKEMADGCGRDTEKDLFGNPGGYITRLSKNTVGLPCPACGSPIQKQAYLGGSIYICPRCQAEGQ
jgi:formamidopyrimidine-DNA glycosylase